jgi:hypothetical protein
MQTMLNGKFTLDPRQNLFLRKVTEPHEVQTAKSDTRPVVGETNDASVEKMTLGRIPVKPESGPSIATQDARSISPKLVDASRTEHMLAC